MPDLPEPPVERDVDLKDFAFTPIYRARLFGSAFHSTTSDAGWRAGVTLWLKSWDQVPAGSLPKDEVSLCRLAELGREIKAWKKVASEALHGWQECADGRLYHWVVAEGVNEAWQRKCARRDRTAAARDARQQQRALKSTTDDVTFSVTEIVTEPVTGSKGQGQGQGQGQGHKEESSEANASAPNGADPVKGLFDHAVKIFGECGVSEKEARNLLGQGRKLKIPDGDLFGALIALRRENPVEPTAWWEAALKLRHRRNDPNDPSTIAGWYQLPMDPK
jgi:hypothetical protein